MAPRHAAALPGTSGKGEARPAPGAPSCLCSHALRDTLGRFSLFLVALVGWERGGRTKGCAKLLASRCPRLRVEVLSQFCSWKAGVRPVGWFGGSSAKKGLPRPWLRHSTAAESPLAKKVTFFSWILYW